MLNELNKLKKLKRCSGKQGLEFAQAGRNVGLGAFEDFLDLPSEAIGLVDATNLGITKARAEQAGELAVTVKALIIHLYNADGIEPGENVFQSWRQRVQVLEMQRRNAVAGSTGTVHRFL